MSYNYHHQFDHPHTQTLPDLEFPYWTTQPHSFHGAATHLSPYSNPYQQLVQESQPICWEPDPPDDPPLYAAAQPPYQLPDRSLPYLQPYHDLPRQPTCWDPPDQRQVLSAAPPSTVAVCEMLRVLDGQIPNPTAMTLEHILARLARLETRLDELDRVATAQQPPRQDLVPPYGMPSNWETGPPLPKVVHATAVTVIVPPIYSSGDAYFARQQHRQPEFQQSHYTASSRTEPPLPCYIVTGQPNDYYHPPSYSVPGPCQLLQPMPVTTSLSTANLHPQAVVPSSREKDCVTSLEDGEEILCQSRSRRRIIGREIRDENSVIIREKEEVEKEKNGEIGKRREVENIVTGINEMVALLKKEEAKYAKGVTKLSETWKEICTFDPGGDTSKLPLSSTIFVAMWFPP